MGNGIKVALQINIYDPGVTGFQKLLQRVQSLQATSSWPKTITPLGKVPLEDWFHHMEQGGLDHSIPDCGYSQRSLFHTAWLGYPDPSRRVRPILPLPQLSAQLIPLGDPFLAQLLRGLTVHPGAAFV